MEDSTIKYIFDYYSHFMSLKEAAALKHYITSYKFHKSLANDKSGEKEIYLLDKNWLTRDSETIGLLKDGFNNFQKRTAERILAEHSNEIFFNNCPQCGKLARTPFAQQCRFCSHDWHDSK